MSEPVTAGEAGGSSAVDSHGGGSEAFAQRTPWTAGAAGFFALLTLGFSIGTAYLAQPLLSVLSAWMTGSSRSVSHGAVINMMLTMFVMQIAIIALVWWGAARFGGRRKQVLSLRSSLPFGLFLYGLVGMVGLLLPYNLLIYFVWPSSFAADLRPFWDLAHSPAVWLAAVVVGVGAPLSEELLFRGFLLPALAKTQHGLAGAALIATCGWTALHSYSLAGTCEVFLIGIYFAWLMWRFANLWLPIALHALYNLVQLAALALWPA